MRFTPTQDFFEPELGSSYVKGLQYTVRPGDEKLRTFVEKWLVERKIAVVDNAAPPSKVIGVGTVS